jgi:LysM repeat protein
MVDQVDVVRIDTIDPPGPAVQCRLSNGPPTFTGPSGWQFTKRPRRESMTEFMGYDPYTLIVPVMFGNGFDDTINVDPQLEVLRGIARNIVGPRQEPAVVQLTCPAVPLTWFKYVINDFKINTEYKNQDGSRYYAQVDITFYKWEPTDLVSTHTSKSVAQKVRAATNAQAAQPTIKLSTSIGHHTGTAYGPPIPVTTPSGATYKVKKGDTLETIAQKTLGSAKKWRIIAAMNGNIRDPKSIKVGQILRLPNDAITAWGGSISQQDLNNAIIGGAETYIIDPLKRLNDIFMGKW